MTRPAPELQRHLEPVEPVRGVAGESVGPVRRSAFLDLVDLLAERGAEASTPQAARDEAEFSAAAITLVRSHRAALLFRWLPRGLLAGRVGGVHMSTNVYNAG